MQNETMEKRLASLRARRPIGGAVIDAQGREIPITESMIQGACRILDKAWIAAPHPGKRTQPNQPC